MNAEICWAFQSLMSNYSYNSCSSNSELFSAMFSDSDIVEKFSMGKTKCEYYVTHGIAPHFESKFLESLQLLPIYLVSFDESYNDTIKRGEMDMHIRFWDSETDRVKVHYLDISFMRKSSAKDVFEYFDSLILSIENAKVFSASPNLNLAFLELLKESRYEVELKELSDIGTYDLHCTQCVSI